MENAFLCDDDRLVFSFFFLSFFFSLFFFLDDLHVRHVVLDNGFNPAGSPFWFLEDGRQFVKTVYMGLTACR